MKKSLLTLILALVAIVNTWAYDAYVDGIYYNLVSKTKQAEVTHGDNKYTGSVTIPESVTVDGTIYSVTSIGENTFYDCSGLTSVTIGNSVTSIGEHAFRYCYNLASITIPNSVISIKDYAFYYCKSLKSISIPNSVTTIGSNAFHYCSGLTTVEIPNSVTSIGTWAFARCPGLISVTISNSVTSIADYIFCDCGGLTSIQIPNSVITIRNYSFLNCTGLKSVLIPNSVTSIGRYAFGNCSGLPSINIPNSVTSIGEWAFEDCTSLTSITIPNGVTSIENNTFKNCSGLTSVEIPNSVTNIGNSAFYGCSGLTSVTIGKSVNQISSEAFAKCSNLENVYSYAESVPTTNSNAFSESLIEYATLHVPDASVQAYSAKEPWKQFGTIISLSGSVQETPKCEKPVIMFANNKLFYDSATDGATIVSEVNSADFKKSYDVQVPLTATYEITAYATKAGYDDSDVATATLCWLTAQFSTDGVESAFAPARPVLISCRDGLLTISGLDDGETASVYTTDGKLLGTTNDSLAVSGNQIVIVKIGNETIKMVVK